MDDLESLFAGADIGIGVIEMIRDAEGKPLDYRLVRINEAFSRIMGYERSAEGRTALEVTPDLNPKWIAAFDAVAREGNSMHIENHAPFGRWFDIRAFRIGSEGSKRVGIMFSDITSRKDAEDALIESERRLNMAIDAGRLAVWEVNLAQGTVMPSPALNHLYGFPSDAAPSLEEYQSRYAPGEQERLEVLGADLLAGRIPALETEVRHIVPGQGERWLLLRAHLDGGTPPTRIIGVAVDVTATKQAELQNTLLRRELEHRIKNILTMVSAIALQTFRGSSEKERVDAFNARLRALADAQSLAMGDSWRSTDIEATMRAALMPYVQHRIDLSGDHVPITPKLALTLALATNELATNALKYGAMSVAEGKVLVRWELQNRTLKWTWQEIGGPPVSSPPSRKGFGSVLIEQVLANDFGGQVHVNYNGGLVCELIAPAPSLDAASA